ncbi:paraquat-inducible protein A [Celeribacter indicus]|uniref:Paraquat-inducible protein A n=1 Tax=Celeribacter indicus TaxID=1208324 RepID=A0A0B5DYQ8_9RHOB|nr:paraquat-inducible protein A [Celeribacter indicus]AJE48119.1 paraquat-inducible protein A [Celeribacter indicus]SDW33060.1 Paraquat-inducible protein A [Celeribacter indicus]
MTPLRLANLSLLLLFPVAWAAPLLKAGLLPLFRLSEISVLSGIASLWEKDIPLALVVILFAMIAPVAKVLALDALLAGRLPAGAKPWLFHLGRLGMADVFLVAIYITVAKGLGVGRLEVGWGLYLFTFCVLASLGLSIFSSKKPRGLRGTGTAD